MKMSKEYLREIIKFEGTHGGIVIGKKWKGIKQLNTEFSVKITVHKPTQKYRYDHFCVSGLDQELLSQAVLRIKELLDISIQRSKMEIEGVKVKAEKEALRTQRIMHLVENNGYCTYHQHSGCQCSRDRDGRVKNGDNYPFEKYCEQHDSIKCDCERLPSGEIVRKAIMRTGVGTGYPVKYCEFHKTWYCVCKRDKEGNVMSTLQGYPIERYCSLHNSIICKCKRDETGRVISY